MPLASTDATAIGLQGGSVDIIATDWLWVSRERSSGADFTFLAFTTALGAIMVPPNSPIKTLADLKGKKLGVAGGPIDKSWLLIVAYALRTANLDLRSETRQEFGAPPLLAEKAKQGEIDAVLNFWPYAARLEAEGFKQLIGIEDVVRELGAKGEVAMVGYASARLGEGEPEAIKGFCVPPPRPTSCSPPPRSWDGIEAADGGNDRMTMRHSKRCGAAIARASPNARHGENESDAKVLYQFLRELGGEKLVGPGTELSPGTFWQGGKS